MFSKFVWLGFPSYDYDLVPWIIVCNVCVSTQEILSYAVLFLHKPFVHVYLHPNCYCYLIDLGTILVAIKFILPSHQFSHISKLSVVWQAAPSLKTLCLNWWGTTMIINLWFPSMSYIKFVEERLASYNVLWHGSIISIPSMKPIKMLMETTPITRWKGSIKLKLSFSHGFGGWKLRISPLLWSLFVGFSHQT